jgi:hypothetical protein
MSFEDLTKLNNVLMVEKDVINPFFPLIIAVKPD